MTVSADIRRRGNIPLHTQIRRLSRTTKSEVIPYNKIGGYPVQQNRRLSRTTNLGLSRTLENRWISLFSKKSFPFLIAQRKVTINGVER